MTNIQTLRLERIIITGNTQCRHSINKSVVYEYAQKMAEGESFPPLLTVSDGKSFWLVDGFHRYYASKEIGFRDIQADVVSGSIEDAQDMALGANDSHGLPRTNDDKRRAVEFALKMERHANKSDREIAKLCKVSQPFVGAVRNPDVKEQQAKNRTKNVLSKLNAEGASEIGFQNLSVIKSQAEIDPIPRLTEYYGPDEAELRANELAEIADREMINKMLEADDVLATAYEEIKRLQLLNAQFEIRIAALMIEKNEAIKDAKRAQRQIDIMRKST